MKVFEIYANDSRHGFRETLDDVKQAAAPLIEQGYAVRIEHRCAPAPTAEWLHDLDWVRTQ